jgi:hypothetical protein
MENGNNKTLLLYNREKAGGRGGGAGRVPSLRKGRAFYLYISKV